jgi:arginyl-tRNA synthetase
VIPQILAAGDAYGSSTALTGAPINLEFVSANPTGPLHLGHTRWAALGDSIGRLLRFAGANLSTEYYINDFGSQMDTFASSIYHRVKGEDVAEGEYPGAYVVDLAERIRAAHPEVLDLPADEALALCKAEGYRLQLAENRETLGRFHVEFDTWFSERRLHEPAADGRSAIDRAIDHLRAQGHIYEHDGALWLRTTTFGDDKDRVLIRADGEPTYFAADAAYYLDKRARGFETAIYLLGADHHGYIGRLKAIAQAAGDDPDRLVCLIGQLVSVDGAKMSKRAGHIIELGDLIEWLGDDALRYWLARYPADTPLALEGEKLRSRTNDNPVFYVQYAHARTVNVQRHAAEAGVVADGFEASALSHPTEEALIARLVQFPDLVGHAAALREPHRIARYLEELAADYHRWYDNCRVVPLGDAPVEAVHGARLQLNNATEQVLRTGLRLIGVSAPDRM